MAGGSRQDQANPGLEFNRKILGSEDKLNAAQVGAFHKGDFIHFRSIDADLL